MAQSWTKQRVLDEIQRLFKHGGRINSNFVQHKNPSLFQAALRRFGNYRNAVIAAGFNYANVKKSEGNVPVVTPEKVIRQIRRIYETHGKLGSEFVRNRWPSLLSAARKRFGSYGAAVKAAGLDYEKIKAREHQDRTVWRPQKIEAELREIYRKHKKLSLKFVLRQKPSLVAAALKHFGSFRKAVEAIGVDYFSVCLRFPVLRLKNRKQVKREIRRRHKLGLPINSMAVYKEACHLYHAAQVHFRRPSWKNALRFSGFDPFDVSPITYWQRKEVVLKEIRVRFNAGKPLYTSYVSRKCVGMYRGAIRVFGSWPNAIKKAGLNWQVVKKPYPRYWTRKTVSAEIRRLEKAGVRLHTKEMKKRHRPLFSSAVAIFGSWDQAVEASGINYLNHCQVWSTNAWLRRLSKMDAAKLDRRAGTLARKHAQYKLERRRK